MLDQIARALCSPAWTSVLATLLTLWWVVTVMTRSRGQSHAMTTIGVYLIAESVTAFLFTYVLLPLAPSRGMARAGLATQLMVLPLMSCVLIRDRARPSRS
jgi:antibiotic biosynthesis monooxygenase (ABM) superfamily enzyme